jgi:hypothetical protein
VECWGRLVENEEKLLENDVLSGAKVERTKNSSLMISKLENIFVLVGKILSHWGAEEEV